MLTFTHTYLLNLAYKKIHQKNILLNKGELILGNVSPDFVTHLGRKQFQATAHNLDTFTLRTRRTPFDWGAIFHILCDNYSTLGRLTFDGSYQDFPKDGFIEKLAQKVIINLPLKIPKRRILQCAFDILVIQKERNMLIKMLQSANTYLQENIAEVLRHVSSIYDIEQDQVKVGLNRFSQVYGEDFIEKAASERYRLFPLIRSRLNLNSLTDPQIILKKVDHHPELMDLIELNLGIIKSDWHELLEDTVQNVLKYPGLKQALTSLICEVIS
jgi:hypothetical protein